MESKSKIINPLQPVEGPELIFGMIGPVGSNLKHVCQTLSKELKDAGYDPHEISVSSLIKLVYPHESIPEHEDKRIEKLMSLGTKFRQATVDGSVLALMAVVKIREVRQTATGNPNVPASRKAYILRSLKRPEEVAALRAIYGEFFFLISAYLPREKRVSTLATEIAKSQGKLPDADRFRSKAEHLVSKDEEEEGADFGQDVSEAFPMADFFVSADSRASIKEGISRFVEILFGYQFHTPSKDEMGMYLARSSALRSADLSRQVGAVIATPDGDIISIGCNEVPKALGGQYWPSDANDDRDFIRGYDSSTVSKSQIIRELIHKLKEDIPDAIFSEGKKEEEISDYLLEGTGRKIFKGTQIQNLLEFGRPVHAEMAAITTAARLGFSIKGTTLYSTTFPCHMCARHIISSGIKRVVYIEPYPKSRVKDLYHDSVVIDPERLVEDKVNFQPFVGIAPSRYLEFFEIASKRKDDT